jgi:hypothetical protein
MNTYDWLDDEAFCAAFVRGLTPHEALARLGIDVIDGEDEEGGYDEGLISAREADGGTILSEWNGYAGTLPHVLARLSAGTVTASVFVNVNAVASFEHYADGSRVLTFDPLSDDDGLPEDFLADRAEFRRTSGASRGALAAALLLAERISEVRPNASTGIVAAHGVLDY